MAVTIDNVEVQDDYDATTTVELDDAAQLSFLIANASVIAQLKRGPRGNYQWTEPFLLAPSAGAFQATAGLRVKNAVAGTPARVIATLFAAGDPQPLGASPFTSPLSAGGTIGGVAGILARVEKASDTSITATTAATADLVATSGAVAVTAGDLIRVTVASPGLRTNNTSGALITACLWQDGTPVANLGQVEESSSANPGRASSPLERSYFVAIAADDSITWDFRAFVSTGAGTVRGGGGGAAFGPAFILVERVTTA